MVVGADSIRPPMSLPAEISVPERAELSDVQTLTDCLLRSAAAWRSSGSSDLALSMCRLLEAAAFGLQQQVAEAKVQRGLAVASQTLAAELSLKCENLAQRALPLTQAANAVAGLSDRELLTPSGAGDEGLTPPSNRGRLVDEATVGCDEHTTRSRSTRSQASLQAHPQPAGAAGNCSDAGPSNALLGPVPQSVSFGPAACVNGTGNRHNQYRSWVADVISPQVATGMRGWAVARSELEDTGLVEELVEKLKVWRGVHTRFLVLEGITIPTLLDGLQGRFRAIGVSLPLEKLPSGAYRLGQRQLGLRVCFCRQNVSHRRPHVARFRVDFSSICLCSCTPVKSRAYSFVDGGAVLSRESRVQRCQASTPLILLKLPFAITISSPSLLPHHGRYSPGGSWCGWMVGLWTFWSTCRKRHYDQPVGAQVNPGELGSRCSRLSACNGTSVVSILAWRPG